MRNKKLNRKFKNTKWTGRVYEVKEWTWKGYTANELIMAACFSFLITCMTWSSFYNKSLPTKINVVTPPRIEAIELKEEIVTERCIDPISCIRDIGNELGVSNKDIMTMIRIAKAESSMNPKAKSKTSSASGLFQIIAGTWYSNDCIGDKFNYEDNITCAYKIYAKRSFQPWKVCSNGMVDCN